VLVWLAAGVVQQVISAVPQLSARLAPLLPFWALAATALLSYAFVSQAPGAVSPANAAPGVALFAALHGLPQLGGSAAKLVATYVVSSSSQGGEAHVCVCVCTRRGVRRRVQLTQK
jgi:hypothetical protein